MDGGPEGGAGFVILLPDTILMAGALLEAPPAPTPGPGRNRRIAREDASNMEGISKRRASPEGERRPTNAPPQTSLIKERH
ncbi:hypothetical protein BLTE_27490 [Blastochloris tepida]|uniref:Uncharacterized protein n=1 Tax=Blastochloris tepida TaxID=2233851 RepID=A0A348G3D1_9HYPH|nr:hypothetical protein BLTE_27490 [Blastochloris tepida]